MKKEQIQKEIKECREKLEKLESSLNDTSYEYTKGEVCEVWEHDIRKCLQYFVGYYDGVPNFADNIGDVQRYTWDNHRSLMKEVKTEFKYMATDGDGQTYIYSKYPDKHSTNWCYNGLCKGIGDNINGQTFEDGVKKIKIIEDND